MLIGISVGVGVEVGVEVGGSVVSVAISVGVGDGKREAVSVITAPDAGVDVGEGGTAVDVAVGSAGIGVSVAVGGGGIGVSVDVGGGGSGVSVDAGGGGGGVSVGVSSEVVRGKTAVPSMPLPYPIATISTAPTSNMTDKVTISLVFFRFIDCVSVKHRMGFCCYSRRGGTKRVARPGTSA
jgi:hypothetical protein